MSDSETPPQSPLPDRGDHSTQTDEERPQTNANQRQDFRAALRRMLTGMSGALSYLNPSNQPSRPAGPDTQQGPQQGPQPQGLQQEQGPQPAPEPANPGFFDRASAEELIAGLFTGAGTRLDDTTPFASRTGERAGSDASGPGAPPFDLPQGQSRPFGVISVYITTSDGGNRSASEAAIASLKAVPLNELPIDVEACPICYEAYEEAVPEPHSVSEQEPEPETNAEQCHDHSPLAMPCGHIFGKACLRTWLDSESSCPMCRHRLEQVARGPQTGSPFASTEFFLLSVIADATSQERIVIQRQDRQQQQQQQQQQQTQQSQQAQQQQAQQEGSAPGQEEGMPFDWGPIALHYAQMLSRNASLFEPAGRAQPGSNGTSGNEQPSQPSAVNSTPESNGVEFITTMNERVARAAQIGRQQREQMRDALRRQRQQNLDGVAGAGSDSGAGATTGRRTLADLLRRPPQEDEQQTNLGFPHFHVVDGISYSQRRRNRPDQSDRNDRPEPTDTNHNERPAPTEPSTNNIFQANGPDIQPIIRDWLERIISPNQQPAAPSSESNSELSENAQHEQPQELSDSDIELQDDAATDSSTTSVSSHASRRRGPNSRYTSHQRSHPYTR